MKGSVGCPARIITAVPHLRELAKGEKRKLSKKAKFRLEVIDYYWRSPARFDARRLSTLENRPDAPKKKREPEYSRELAKRAREIRKENPTYSRDKTRAGGGDASGGEENHRV